MNKNERIEKYGEGAYEKHLKQSRQWQKQWKDVNPDKVDERNHNLCRKGGKYYEKTQKYQTTGLQGDRNKIRIKHAKKWGKYKKTIAPESQIHHQWRPCTSEYDGVALVEKDQHQHGIIDVIRILDGKITVLTEAELKRGVK